LKINSIYHLVNHLLSFGDRPAVGLRQSLGARWWSYRELCKAIYQFAGQLDAWDIPAGSRIILWAPNCPEWIAVLMGALLQGVVVVPIDESASVNLVHQIAKEVNPTLLVHGSEQNVDDFNIQNCSIYAFSDINRVEKIQKTITQTHLDDPALIIYTSGTTQSPKGVILTHKNILIQVENFKRWSWLLQWIQVRLLSLSPLSHIQGLMLGGMIPLSMGLSVLYSDSVAPHHVIRTIRQNRVTALLAVPRVQYVLAEALRNLPSGRKNQTLAERVGKINFFPLRRHFLFLATHAQLGYSFWVLLVGGANLPKEDERFWYECGYVLAQGYGLTETAALVSININSPFFAHLGSIGKPIGKQEVMISEDGEVLVKGENVSPGYFQNQLATASHFKNGYLRTGDLARRDDRDKLYFNGRKKEIIVTSEGHNVYPQDIEAVLNLIPGVIDAIVIGHSQAGLTEVHAVLLLEDHVDVHQIMMHANQMLETHQKIHSWSRWPDSDFPRTSLQKIKRKMVEEIIEQADLTTTWTLHSSKRITLSMIQETGDRERRLDLLCRYLSDENFNRVNDETLNLAEDLGLSSLDTVDLLTRLEQRTNIGLTNIVVSESSTLFDLRQQLKVIQHGQAQPAIHNRAPVKIDHPLFELSRRLLTPFVLPTWVWLKANLEIDGLNYLDRLEPPCILAGAHHEHGFDALAVYNALPNRFRKKLVVITSAWVFREYLDPSEDVTIFRRLFVGAAFQFGMPLLFPYTVWPKSSAAREGLLETCRLIDRGYSSIVFPEGDNQRVDPGPAYIAIQTQTPIVPLRLAGNHVVDFRPRRNRPHISLKFGPPIFTSPEQTAQQVTEQLFEAFRNLNIN